MTDASDKGSDKGPGPEAAAAGEADAVAAAAAKGLPDALGDAIDLPPDLAQGGDVLNRIRELEAELEERTKEVSDKLLRAMAETENVRRRLERERDETAKFAVAGFAKNLLSVADNLRRAVDSVPADERQSNEFLNTLLSGVEATERELVQAFDKAGIEKVEPIDQPFDPNFHEVMFEMPGGGKPAGTVMQVLQAGYVLNGRLLRAARVGVAKAGDPGAPPDHKVNQTV